MIAYSAGRIAEANSYVSRLNRRLTLGGVTLEEALMGQRAATLNSGDKQVQEVAQKSQQIISDAVESYLRGIGYLRSQQYEKAAEELTNSRSKCDNILHQRLLATYCQTRGQNTLTEESREVLAYYMKAPIKDVEASVRQNPALNFLRPLGPTGMRSVRRVFKILETGRSDLE
jgi:hypothetical protein